MEETFREFHIRSGATMIYVTHYQSEAMTLATDVAVMSEGRLLQMASPEEIYARPEGHLVGGLVGQGSILTVPFAPGSPRLMDWSRLSEALRTSTQGAVSARVLVRPQDVILDASGIPACVTSSFFEGERYALRLELPDGQMLRGFSRQPVRLGDRVNVVLATGWRL